MYSHNYLYIHALAVAYKILVLARVYELLVLASIKIIMHLNVEEL